MSNFLVPIATRFEEIETVPMVDTFRYSNFELILTSLNYLRNNIYNSIKKRVFFNE